MNKIYMQYNLKSVMYIGEKERIFKEAIYPPFPKLNTGDVVIVDAKTAALLTRPHFGFEHCDINALSQTNLVGVASEQISEEMEVSSENNTVGTQNESEQISEDMEVSSENNTVGTQNESEQISEEHKNKKGK